MKKSSLLFVSWLCLAGCGGVPEEQAPAGGEVSAQSGSCYIKCDDGRETTAYAGSQTDCSMNAYNWCYPYGGSTRYTSDSGEPGPGQTW